MNVVNGDPGMRTPELLRSIKNSCGVEFCFLFFKFVDIIFLCTHLEETQTDQREPKLIEFVTKFR